MLIKCPKCKKALDPSRWMMRCGPHGHDPCVEVPEYQNIALTEGEEKPRQRSSFQSDFRLIWDEHERPRGR